MPEHNRSTPRLCWCDPVMVEGWPAPPLAPFHRMGEPMRPVFSQAYTSAGGKQLVWFHVEPVTHA